MAIPVYPKAATADLLDKVRDWKRFDGFKPMDLGVKKALSIVTCMDSRIMPATMFGLELGDAEYIRNAGGRVTPDVIRSLALTNELLNTKTILLIHHTDCGAQAAVKHHDLLEEKIKQLGTSIEDLGELYPISSGVDGVRASVKEDFDKLRASPHINPAVEIHGLVYHTHEGDLEEVISYTPTA